LTSPAGHFMHNKNIRPAFNKTLKELGYTKIWVDRYFGSGTKEYELCPSLWQRLM
jgi:hypothetical protein